MSYRFRVITPLGKLYEGNILHAMLPGEDGFVGILKDHAPYLTTSAGGRLSIRETSGAEKYFWVGKGFFEVRKNEAVFITESFSSKEG